MKNMNAFVVILWLLVLGLSPACKEDSSEICFPVPDPDTSSESFYEWKTVALISTIEAETGSVQGTVQTESDKAGHSGTGYLTGFWDKSAKVTIHFEVPKNALYTIQVRYQADGINSNSMSLNGAGSVGLGLPKTDGFQMVSLGHYPLKAGINTLTFQGDWGNVFLDSFSVLTALKNTYAFDKEPADPYVTVEAKQLYAYLLANFGKNILSGYLDENIKGISRRPLLLSSDLYSYTNGYPWKWDAATGKHVLGAVDNGSVAKAIKWYKESAGKGIVEFHWHWCSPIGGEAGTNTFYTNQTQFDVRKAVTPGTAEYDLILQDIDAIAAQLKRLQDAGVPVIFRPLHEAGGKWFWWGAQGAEPCLKLFDILYERLTSYHHLHHLLWAWSTPEREWYPGNERIDLVGQDSYPGEHNYNPQQYAFQRLYTLTNGKKLIAMTENGPIPDIQNCLDYDTPWSFFMPWGDLLYSQNDAAHIAEVFAHPAVISFPE